MTGKPLQIARFEFTRTVRRRGFIIGTLGLPLLMIGIFALSLYTGSGIATAAANQTVGYVDGAGFVRAAPGFVPYADPAAGTAALTGGKIQSLAVIPADYLANGTLTIYTMDASLFGSTGSAAAVQSFLAENLLRHENVPENAARQILSPPSPSVIVLDESGSPKGSQQIAGFLLPFAMSLVMALGIMTSSGYLMQGIGEEKESRRGEFLLSYCSATELLAGKILGYAAVSLLQIAVWIAIALTALAASPLATVLSGIQISGLVGIAVVYFVLGYLLFSVSIACAASLAPSVREAQQVSAVFTMFAVLPLVFLQLLIADPNSAAMQALTYFPYTAPFIGMVRLTLVSVPPYQIVLSMAILVAAIALLTRLAGRIFRMGMLTYGKRAGIRDVWRFIRDR